MNQPRINKLEKIQKKVNDARALANDPHSQEFGDDRTPFLILADAVESLVQMAIRQEL